MKICLDLRLPAVKQHIDKLYNELNGKISKENIAFSWNYWYRTDRENADKQPTIENIVDSYTELEALTAQDEFNNTSVTDKQAVIDLLQSLYFTGLEQMSGSEILTREMIAKHQKEVFETIPEILDSLKLFFISDSFEDYKQYFVSQRLRKFQVPEEDLEAEETKEKDTISSQSSVYNDPFARVSDEALYLVASLKSNETVFGLPKPVNYNEVVNVLQNSLAGGLNIIDHAETLKSIKDKYYWVSQVMDKLGIFEDGFGPEEIYGGVRTSFNEAFSKTQMDIITSSVGKKQAYSALESQTRESLKNRYRTNFNNGEYSHTVNGKRIFNWPKYHALGLTKKPEDLIKFLEIFGIELNPNIELTDPDLYDIEQMKHFVDIYKYTEKEVPGEKWNPLQWLDSEIIDVSSRLNNIIELQIPFENETKKLSVNNAEGKKLYAVSNNNFFSRIFNKLKLGKQKAIGNYQELIAQDKIKLAILSGSQFGSEGKVFNKLDESTILNTFITNMFSNTPIISIPRTADKTMERAIKITDIKAKDLNKVMAWTTINDDILKQFYKAFEQDVAQKFDPDWIYAGKGAKAIDFWTEAFGLEAGAKFSEFKEAILKHIAEQNQETYDYWLNQGVIYLKETDKGTFMNFSFTDNILDKMNIDWKSSNEVKEAGVRKIINNYNFNNLYFGVLNTQMTQGSMMGVKIDNFYKRTSGPAAESRQNRVDYLIVDKINSEMKELGLPFVGDKFKVFIHSDTLSSNNDKFILDISDEYGINDKGDGKINTDDAQGIMHLAVYRNLHQTNKQWLPRQEEAFQKIMRGEKLDKESYDVIFPAKPVGYSLITVVKDGETYKIPIYIKTAVYPISPADVKGTMNELKYNLMMEKGIGLFLPESGIKMAVPRHLQPLFKDGKIQFDERNTFDFPMEDFGIQLDINAKTTHDQLFGTQIRKQLMSNLFEHGSSDPKYVKWVEDNIDTIQKLNDIETKKLYAKAGVQEVNNNGIITYTITDYTKLAKMVKDELMSREMPTNVLDSISSIINKEGNLLGTIDALPARQKIMNLLNSIVTNKLIRQYINGTASVQISQQGWELQKIDNPTNENIIAIDSAIDFVSNDAKIAYYHNNGVSFFTSKDGRTAEAGCLLSSKYKSFVKKDEEGNYIIDDERVLVSIGYRIPTQGHNSALHLKVAGFLPAHLGQMIVLPKEITVQSGGDFDVDKVNIFLPNTITLNGVTTFISEDMDPEEIYEQLKAEQENAEVFNKLLNSIFGEDTSEEEKPEDISNKDKFIDVFITKQLQNKLISQAVAILEDPKIATQMITPNSPGTLKEKAAKIAEAKVKAGIPLKDLKVTLKNMFNGVTLAKITNQMFASKALVGVFASQATHHVLAQQVGLHFDTGRPFFFPHNQVVVDGEPKPSLSNIKTVTGELISDKLGNNKLTAAVDAAKKNYLAELGITIDTGDVAALFDRLGGNEDYLFAWLELPIIQDYLKASKFNSSLVAKATKQTMSKEKLIKKVMKKHGLITDTGEFELGYSSQYLTEMDNDYKAGAQLLEARAARGEYTVDELNDVIYNKKSNPKLLLDLLDDFLYFQEASLILRQSISTSKFDTAGPGKNLLESFILQLKYNKFVEKMALGKGYTLKTIDEGKSAPYTNLIHKTLLSVFYKKSFNFVMDLYKNMTVMTMDNNYDIQSVVKSLISKDEYKFVNKDATTTEAELIYGSIVNHIIQNQINLDKSLFFGNNSLADKIIKIQEDVNHPLHDNEIIQDYFNIELSADNLTPNLLTPLNKNLPIEDSNQYTAAFEQIKEEDIDLYNDFLNVSLFQTGVIQSPSSFYNILPEKDTFAKTNPLLSNSSSINYDAKQVAKSVIANIGSKMTNLKTVYLSNSEFKPNSAGIVDVKEVVYAKFEGYQFARVMVNEKEHFVMELEPGKFEVIKPQNHKVLFYNHTSDNLELPVTEDEFQNADDTEENPFIDDLDKTFGVEEITNSVIPLNENFNRSSVEKDKDYIYLFTDNAKRTSGKNSLNNNSLYALKYTTSYPLNYPTMTQAVIRGLNNAFPITTMVDDNRTQWKDSQFDEYKKIIDSEIEDIKQAQSKFKGIKFAAQMPFGQGKISNMKIAAPKIWDYMTKKLAEIGIDNTGNNPKIINNKPTTMWDSLEDWQKEKLKLVVTPEYFNSFDTKKQDKYIECYAKIKD